MLKSVPIPLAVEAIAAPDARQNQALVQPDRIRNYFPESWLWFTPKTG